MEEKIMYKEIKERLKSYAKEITSLKEKRKPSKNINPTVYDVQSKLNQLKYHFMAHHTSAINLPGSTPCSAITT